MAADTNGTPKVKRFTPTPEQYKKAIKALGKIGAVDYKVSDTLSKSQRATLRAKMQEYAHYIKRPEDFVVRKVSEKTAKAAKGSGIKATPTNRVVIPKKGFSDVHISGDKVVFKGHTKKGAKWTETVSLIGSPDFEAHIKHLSKKKLKRNQALSVKIGDSAVMNRTFQSVAELTQYVNTINFNFGNRPKQSRDEVLRQISIVEVDTGTAPQYAKKKETKKKR